MTDSIAVTTVDSPVGPLLVAATRDGVLRISFHNEHQGDVLEQLQLRVGPLTGDPGWLDEVLLQLEQYFAGRRRAFELRLDRRLSSGFRREAQDMLATIPYGEVRTYAEVAAAAGRPRAVRAMGSACATNPLPVVLPCHRVVRSDGSLGGFAGGLGIKEQLLAMERAVVAAT